MLVLLVVVAAGCDWPMFRAGPAGTGFNSTENKIGVANVGSLVRKWEGATDFALYGTRTSPAVANGVVYVSSDDGPLYAFNAAGKTGCSGTPKTCSPLWTAPAGVNYSNGAPAVANGVVYVTATDGTVTAFDAAGTTGCAGTPKTCSPLWTATVGSPVFSSPIVANGFVYVSSDDGKLYVFDAAGTTGCAGTPKTCSPVWTATIGGGMQGSSPAIANGVAYVGSKDGKVYAFDAAGTTGCAGTPKSCTPLWTTVGSGGSAFSSPVVANGFVYVSSDDRKLYAFGAAGTTGCSGTPKTCSPLWWTANINTNRNFSPAVAKGVVYVGGFAGLFAFDAAGTTGCSGTPKTCSPLWTALPYERPYPDYPYSLAVANGVVYVGGLFGGLFALDAAGTTGCSGTPKTCNPLWFSNTIGSPGMVNQLSSPAVANGLVYYHTGLGDVLAFGLP